MLAIRRNHPRYGFKRIFIHLVKISKLKINKKRAYRVYTEQGLQLKRRKRRPDCMSIVESVFLREKLGINIIQDIRVNRPYQVLRTDFTEIRTAFGKYSFIAYVCDYSKRVVGWNLGSGPSAETALKALEPALRYADSDTYVHQDQGSAFTSEIYVSKLMEHDVYISYSEKGEPTDNGPMESFFGRFKDEWKNRCYRCKNFNELYLLINTAIIYYNTQRIHTALGNTPETFLRDGNFKGQKVST